MPQERTYDYEYLRDLFREHPEWTHRQLASAVTEHEREKRKNPAYPHITTHAIASVLYRYRDTWAENGTPVPNSKHDPTSRKLPFTNVPREYWFLGPMQNLRRLAKMENGEYVPANKAREAEAMARRLRKNKQVVDLTYKGEPYIRDARPDELDQEGNLVNYFAKYPGLTDKEWRDLRTPEARGAASQRWRHES